MEQGQEGGTGKKRSCENVAAVNVNEPEQVNWNQESRHTCRCGKLNAVIANSAAQQSVISPTLVVRPSR